MVLVQSNRCRLCPKVFCCSDCREEHERLKHPPAKCAICLNEPLPFLPYSDRNSREKSELFCHLVFNHLPLHCKLCGDQFTDNQDLAKAKICKWWLRKSQEKEVPCTSAEATPVSGLQQQQSTTKKHLLKPEAPTFDSPPELVRQTSTPVHQPPGLHPTNSLFKQISAPPHFVLPNTPSPGPLVDSIHNTNYYTPETTLPKQNDNRANQSRAEQTSASSWGVPSYSSLKSFKRGNDSAAKRVRFSDQCQPIMSTSSASSALDTSSSDDVFFEAKESLDEPSPDACDDCCYPKENSLAPSCNENNNNIKNNDNNNNNNNNNKQDEAGAKSVISSTVEGKSTTRVLMMLLVEQTDTSSLSSLDLRPLIDSGLKKLQESADSASNSLEALENKNSPKGSHERSVEQKLSGAEVCSGPACNKATEQQQPGASASDRIERSVSSPPAGQQSAEAPDSGGLVSFKSDGLFSVMARAFRSALNKLPAAVTTARSLSREPVPQIGYSSPDVTSEMSYSIASSQVVLQQRTTTKRSRADSNDESPHATAYDSPGQSSNSSNNSSGSNSSSNGAVLSPVAKRPRGWYRIRGRQPIARMRQLSSPRGTSLETQRFQQGTLTVRDTQLPLPSRAQDAHQPAHRYS